MKKYLATLLLMLCIYSLMAQKRSYQDNIDLANQKMNAKIYEEAIALIDAAIAKKPKVAANYYLKGLCFFRQYKYKEAIEQFDKAIARNTKESKYFKYRGDSYYNTEAYEPALQDYNKAIELDKNKKSDTLFWYRADTYRKLNRYKEAISDYDKAISLNSENSELFYHRAYMYALIKDTLNACQDYQKAYDMGVVRAQREAYSLLRCKWAIPTITKDERPVGISQVEVEPFTGAVIVARGLKYEKYEFVPDKQLGFITGASFGFDEPFIFRIHSPKGFREDEEGKIFFGAGFAIYENEKELGGVQDLFADNYEGVDAELLSNLRLTLRFTQPLEAGKTYILKVKFFDKKSNAALDMQMPFTMAQKTLQTNTINTTKSVITLGAESKSTKEVNINKISFLEAGKSVSSLKIGTNYQILLAEINNLSENINLQYAWVAKKDGTAQYSEKINAKIDKKGQLPLQVVSPKHSGEYILWLYISQKDDPSRIWAVSYPVNVL